MENALDYIRSTAEIAAATGLSTQRIGHLKDALIEMGLARMVGKVAVYHEDAVEWIINRPDGRGKYERKLKWKN